MLTYVLKRLLLAIRSLIGVLTVVFFIVRIAPGDPAVVILGESANAASLAALRDQLGLNKPLYLQYAEFIGSVLQGDLGRSMVSNQPVLAEVWSVLPFTLELTFAAMLIGVTVGVPLGVLSAQFRNGKIDYVVRLISFAGLSFPAFISAILLLLVFAITIPIFPVIGEANYDEPVQRLRALVLPALNLGFIMIAYIARVTRSSMLSAIGQDYCRTAQAKGASPSRVVGVHAVRNALLPVVTVVGLYLGVLIGNSVLTEIVFNRPGLGKLIVIALTQRDYPTLQALLVVYAIFIVIANIITDLTYGLIDPRVRNP
jgi:ABC-type dipeptide/oligopeptide/nickel transport system permease component